jgi:hypothetical protein
MMCGPEEDKGRERGFGAPVEAGGHDHKWQPGLILLEWSLNKSFQGFTKHWAVDAKGPMECCSCLDTGVHPPGFLTHPLPASNPGPQQLSHPNKAHSFPPRLCARLAPSHSAQVCSCSYPGIVRGWWGHLELSLGRVGCGEASTVWPVALPFLYLPPRLWSWELMIPDPFLAGSWLEWYSARSGGSGADLPFCSVGWWGVQGTVKAWRRVLGWEWLPLIDVAWERDDHYSLAGP